MTHPLSIQLHLPAWVPGFLARLPSALDSPEERMRVAISLAEANVANGSGGPFGALVVSTESGQVLAVGVNRVEPACCSSAHAEIIALSLAQQRLGSASLANTPFGPLELVTSCEPCAMCLGAIHWSGVGSVLCGATKADAESVGFDEGERSDHWIQHLQQRGIMVHTGVLRQAAAEVLQRYARGGGTIY